MLLESRANYLVLHNHSDTERSVELLSDLATALLGWGSGTRVSPIWPLREYGGYAAEPDRFAGSSTLVFVGPVQPARLTSELRVLADTQRARIWASMGCFNVIIGTADLEVARDVKAWARANQIPFEAWSLEDGKIVGVENLVRVCTDLQTSLVKLGELAVIQPHPAMRAAFEENLAVTATALARSAAMYAPAYEDFKAITEVTAALVATWQRGEFTTLELQSRLITANAAISRFSSQAFSGIPPLVATECHFWIHSLLGTGSANIALSRLVGWVQQLLDEADLPQRVAQLETHNSNVPTLASLTQDPSLIDRDPLNDQDPVHEGPPIPLVTYFSGRDGFSSHLHTLSAPLTAIAECNSYRSNLLTVTHEIAHILVQVLFTHIYPNLDSTEDLELAAQIAQPNYSASNWLMAARQLLIEAIIGMEQASNGCEMPASELSDVLPEVLHHWRREVQEIIVHTLDFWYFYRSDPAFYVRSIWHSWCAIPGIAERVPEYLMRTLCAVSVSLLKEPAENRFPAAIRDVRQILDVLRTEGGLLSEYISTAVEHLDRAATDAEFRRELEQQYSTRLLLVRLVAIFLASDKLSARLYHDPHVGKGSGYEGKQPLAYDQEPIGNPLTFFRGQLTNDPAESESLWVLHCLAFDLVGRR
jgi:hypothetical protein